MEETLEKNIGNGSESGRKPAGLDKDEQFKRTLKEKLVYVIEGVALSVASKIYPGPYANFVHGYGHDVALPFMSYWWCRIVGDLSGADPKRSKIVSVAIPFLMCSAGEFAQYFKLYGGTFDPYDFLAYGLGIALALGIDSTFKAKNKKQGGLESLV